MRALVFGSALLWTAMTLASVAHAQSTDDTTARSIRTTARREFQRGLEAATAADWAGARDSFRRSYELLPQPRTLSNLATALAHLGALVESVDDYRLVVADTTAPESVREEARRALSLVEPRLARVHVQTDAGGEHHITIDGVDVPLAIAGAEVPVDPGEHEIVLSLHDRVCAHATVVVGESERSVAALAACVEPIEAAPIATPPLPPVEDPAPAAATTLALELPAPEPPPPDEIWQSPWLWIGLGVLVAGAVAVGVAVPLSQSPSLPSGNVAGTGVIVVP